MNTPKRVVVTGLGQVSPVGNNISEAWANLTAGKSGIGTITRFDTTGLACTIAGEVANPLAKNSQSEQYRQYRTYRYQGQSAQVAFL